MNSRDGVSRLQNPNLLSGVLLLVLLGCAAEPAAEAQPARVVEWSCADEMLSASPMRRLTRFEYANTVSDVFGLELDIENLLPRDEVALGFDNQAGALTVTDLHVAGFQKVAEQISEAALTSPERLTEIAGCNESDPSCAEATARRLGRLLLRRPLASAEVDRLLALFERDYSAGGYREGMSRLIAALLQAPEFLYRIDRSPALAADRSGDATDTNGLDLPPEVLASRLSFLLWGSGPDSELLDAVERGGLRTRDSVAEEARRMLADDRAKRGVMHFFEQWLGMSSFEEVEKDLRLFPAWDAEVHADLRFELRRFLEAVLWEDDARFNTLLTARYTYMTPILMDFYGAPITSTDLDQLVRVDFGKDEARLGVLTQGALMSHLAKANQTDPIHRGKFIRERFFCTVPPPPPPNIVVAPPQLDPRKTTRQRFEQHRADPACATCHELLDPIGLAFEHYDALGRYRGSESGVEIDASGELIDTDVDGPIQGAPDLADRLSQSAEVRQCMVKQVFRYAFGRGETELDNCALDKLEQEFLATDGDLIEILVAVTQIRPFTSMAPAPPAEEEQ